VLCDLALKTAHALPRCTTKWIAGQMHLPVSLVEELLEQMAKDHLLEVLGQEGPFNRRYTVSGRGHERALRLLNISGYVGPAPVSLEAYSALIYLQHSQFPEVSLQEVQQALGDLVLPADDIMTAALAFMSQRSLFVFGPPGNGKTSLARLLHNVVERDLWIPHAICVGSEVIRLFDTQIHQRASFSPPQPWKVDQRWVRIRRPFIVAGGEMTIESLEMAYSSTRGYYEAPLHIKSNGGTFMIDDLGRQRVEPSALLNRWIIPLEHGFDYFSLHSGHKIKVPFQQMLLVATNLEPERVMDPAFLRRMGYRVHLATPGPERYREIFEKYAARWHAEVPSGLVDRLLERYRSEGRELRGCEPRDLIGRAQDICQLRRTPLELNDELLDLAWTSYFGTKRNLER
jgi:predicted ATPase with chaperone activity